MISIRIRFRNLAFVMGVTMLWLSQVNHAAAQDQQLPVLLQELHEQRDSAAYVNTLGKIGTLYMMINIDSGFRYAIRELEMAERLQYPHGIADAFDVISYRYALRTDFSIAAIYAYRALQLYKSLSDSVRICNTLNNLYIYYLNMGRKDDAGNYFYEAFQMASRLPATQDSLYSMLLVNYVMRFYQDSTRRDSLQWALRKAKQLADKYPRSRFSLYIDAFAADSLVRQGRGKEGEAVINKLATAALHRGLPYVAMEIYSHLEDYPAMGYPINMTYYRELSYDLAKKAGCAELNLSALAGLFKQYRATGDKGKTAYYSQEIMRLAAARTNVQSREEINYIDYFVKQEALRQQAARNQQLQAALEEVTMRRRSTQMVITGVFTIVLLLMVLLYFRYQEYRLAGEQEEMMAESYASISLKHVALRANDEFKNKLITILANDFRMPLYYISEVATRLREPGVDPATMVALIRKIAAVSGDTLAVFDNILKWIRLQLSGFTYQPVDCHAYDLLLTTLHQVESTAAEKKLEIVNQLPANCIVKADPEMLRTVFLHILQLSVHYSQPGRSLLIITWTIAPVIYIRFVVDTGIGATDVITSLSNWQDNTHALNYAITRDFLEKMNGVMEVTDSEDSCLVITVSLRA